MNHAAYQQPRTEDPLDKVAQLPTAPDLSAYFYGQMLTEEAFRREQLSHRHRQALLARLLAGRPGVLEGLSIEIQDNAIVVSPGVAIDAIGRLIVVPDPATPNPLTQNGKSGPARLELATQSIVRDLTISDHAGVFELILHPALMSVEESPVLAGEEDGGPRAPDYQVSAYREGYCLQLRHAPQAPATVFGQVDSPAFPLDPSPRFASGRPALLADQFRSESVRLEPQGVVLGCISISRTGSLQNAMLTIEKLPPPDGRNDLPSLADLEAMGLQIAAALDVCLGMAARLEPILGRQSLAIVAGNGQSGHRGEVLPGPVAVRVVDLLGRPVPEARVVFQVSAGNGGVGQADGRWYTTLTATTDTSGVAAICWRLGPGSGFNSIEVRLIVGAELIPGPQTLSFFAWGEPRRQPDPIPAPCQPLYHKPPPAPGDRAVEPPRLIAMAPWGSLGSRAAEEWKAAPTLSLRFDHPMLEDDLASPGEWLHVFRVCHPLAEKGLGQVAISAVSVEGCDFRSGSEIVFRLKILNEPSDAVPGVCVYYLVIIHDGSNRPRSVYGETLAAAYAGTGLSDEWVEDLVAQSFEPGESRLVPISWTQVAPRDGAALPSGADGEQRGTFHASFQLGD